MKKMKKEDLSNPTTRAKYAYFEACVSIAGNSILFLIKLFLGLLINSLALITDAVHTLSDTATSFVIILGFRESKKAPDKEHPFGHGRFEYITTLAIAILLFVAGAEFIRQSLERLVNSVEITKSDYLLPIGIVIILSSLVKEAMARFSERLGRKIKSPALKADAWHHRSDALTSVAVGIAIIGAYYDLYLLDPIFGMVVSILIIYVAVTLFKFSSDTLVGKAPEEELVSAINDAAISVSGVSDAHRITVHDYGLTKIVSLHVEVDCDMSAERAHEIAKTVEDRISDVTKSTTVVHVDPSKEPLIITGEVEKAVRKILEENKDILFYHKVRIIPNGEESRIEMHIVVDSDMSVQESHDLSHNVRGSLENQFPKCVVNTHIEPCSMDCDSCPGICKKK